MWAVEVLCKKDKVCWVYKQDARISRRTKL